MISTEIKQIDATLLLYFKNNNLPEIYEAILAALLIVQPVDHIRFIINCIKKLKNKNLAITHDMFISEHLRPSLSRIIKGNVYSIFFSNDQYEPTEEAQRISYSFYINKMNRKYFNFLMQNHFREQLKKEQRKFLKKRLQEMQRKKFLFYYFTILKEKYLEVKGVRTIATSRIKKVVLESLSRLLIHLWRQQTQESKNTREYFEKLEVTDISNIGNSSQELALGNDEISKMPISISSAIFSYLDLQSILRCEVVCRSWNAIVQTNTLWSRINFSEYKNWVSDRFISKQINRAQPFLLSLNLSNCPAKNRSFLSVSLCPNIIDINLSRCQHFTDAHLCRIIKSCSNLKYLNISYTTVTDVALQKTSQNCQNLKFLNIAFCKEITEKGVYFLTKSFLSSILEYLDISGCGQITPNGFFELANTCVNIRTLIINMVPGITDICLKFIGEKMQNLEHISLIGATRLTDRAFKDLYEKAKDIKKIEIGYNSFVTNETLKLTQLHCQSVTSLALVNCFSLSDKGMRVIAQFPNLKFLNISNCVRISDNGVRNLAEGLCGNHLRELNLTNCYLIGNVAIQAISRKCLKLRFLWLCFCDQINQTNLELLNNLQNLVSLDLSGCSCSDMTLSALNSNRMISSLNLSGCFSITDGGIQKLTYQYSQLEHIDLSNCNKITDAGVKFLSINCRYLKTLKLSSCFEITDMSVKCISNVCPYLTKLDLSGCHLLSNRTLKYLKIGCKRLDHLRLVGCTSISPTNAMEIANVFRVVEYGLSKK